MNDKRMKDVLESIARRGVPENTNLWPGLEARLERKSPMTIFRTRPFVAILVALIILLTLSGVAYALGRVFGYIPGVGLVENNTGMRVLAEPASVTRDGVTLTVTQALVYPDHVQLVYEVNGIAHENDGGAFSIDEANREADQTSFCGFQPNGQFTNDGDARLRLPDGSMVDRVFGTDKYPENVFAMKPAYEVVIPPDVTELTMVLKCIPWARLGAVPENWEVPLKLKYVPSGTVIGVPVLEVTPSAASAVSDNGVTITLDKVVPQDDSYSFYFAIAPSVENKSLLTYYPASAYMIDATRQKIAMVYMHPWAGPYDNHGNLWELQPADKPANGPYTLGLDKLFAYYQVDGIAFEFDPGQSPQLGQIWPMDQIFYIGNVEVKVVSAKLVEKDLSLSDWGLPATAQGIEFLFHSVDGKTPIKLDITDNDGTATSFSVFREPAVDVAVGLYYEKGIPARSIPVTINNAQVAVSGHWELQWASPNQNGITLLDQAVKSTQNPFDVTASLARVVKLDDGYLFYLHMTASEARPDFRVIEPGMVYVIDSTGKKIPLELHGPQLYIAQAENLWEFGTQEQIAAGPIQVVIEDVSIHYNAWDWNTLPAPEVIAAHSFTFDAGADPQPGQTWPLDAAFEIGGYKGKVISVRAVTVDSQNLPFLELRSDASINSGYEFTIQALDPSLQWKVMVSLARPEGSPDFVAHPEGVQDFVDCIGYLPGTAGNTTTHTVTCRGLPASILQVTIDEISVFLNGVWEMDWILPAE